MYIRFTLICCLFALVIRAQAAPESAETIIVLNECLTTTISIDKFNPPQASRIYAYVNSAAFEAVTKFYPDKYRSLGGQMKGLKETPEMGDPKDYHLPTVMTYTFLKVAGHLIYSEETLRTTCMKQLAPLMDKSVSEQVRKNSEAYALKLAQHFIDWSNGDGYAQRKRYARYLEKKDMPDKWVSTPPSYLESLEPNWARLRCFTMDSARQFRPEPHWPYSTDTNSRFYKETMEVYNVVKNNKESDLAWFWDDNCKATKFYGHYMERNFKQTPIGHWINISGYIIRLKKLPLDEATEAHALVSVSIAEAILSTWAEKYASELVRPVTYINRLIDPKWMPILETPYFPEHPSGHGCISAAAATILGSIVGDNITYTDSSTLCYGRQPMQYTSLIKAAHDATMSRMYGGIHYRRGCEVGHRHGIFIGEYVCAVVQTRRRMKK